MASNVRSPGRHRSVPARPRPLSEAIERALAAVCGPGQEWPGCEGRLELPLLEVADITIRRSV